MAFFTIIGVIVVAFIAYAIFRGATETHTPSIPQRNALVKQHSMSLLLTHHMCSEKDIKHRIMTNLEIYDMFPDNMKNNASIFLAKAREEALKRNVHMEDTQSFIVAEWIMEVYEKESKNEIKQTQNQIPVSSVITQQDGNLTQETRLEKSKLLVERLLNTEIKFEDDELDRWSVPYYEFLFELIIKQGAIERIKSEAETISALTRPYVSNTILNAFNYYYGSPVNPQEISPTYVEDYTSMFSSKTVVKCVNYIENDEHFSYRLLMFRNQNP